MSVKQEITTSTFMEYCRELNNPKNIDKVVSLVIKSTDNTEVDKLKNQIKYDIQVGIARKETPEEIRDRVMVTLYMSDEATFKGEV